MKPPIKLTFYPRYFGNSGILVDARNSQALEDCLKFIGALFSNDPYPRIGLEIKDIKKYSRKNAFVIFNGGNIDSQDILCKHMVSVCHFIDDAFALPGREPKVLPDAECADMLFDMAIDEATSPFTKESILQRLDKICKAHVLLPGYALFPHMYLFLNTRGSNSKVTLN